MKYVALGLISLLLAACSPSMQNNTKTSQFYNMGDSKTVLVSGELTDKKKLYGVGVTQARHLVVKFDDSVVVDGILSDIYEGTFTGTYDGETVEVNCHYPKISGHWHQVSCSVEHGGEWAATLTF